MSVKKTYNDGWNLKATIWNDDLPDDGKTPRGSWDFKDGYNDCRSEILRRQLAGEGDFKVEVRS
ncbi:MAG: hypothetical protein EBV86_01295 [Marivivens sp.]|nr:hypothetical protein [Marivivens sp.]NBT49971.1 hypothetical protein [Marivivens sp.]NCW67191.1 hypothetical protein [Marivivens sp.]